MDPKQREQFLTALTAWHEAHAEQALTGENPMRKNLQSDAFTDHLKEFWDVITPSLYHHLLCPNKECKVHKYYIMYTYKYAFKPTGVPIQPPRTFQHSGFLGFPGHRVAGLDAGAALLAGVWSREVVGFNNFFNEGDEDD